MTKVPMETLGSERIINDFFTSESFASDNFDVIIFRNLLEHLYDVHKFIDAADIAAFVLFLASPLSIAITGETIAAGGGAGNGIFY